MSNHTTPVDQEIPSRPAPVRTMAYQKPWQSYEDQLQTLIGRGLEVTDRQRAIDYLERIGYYRLSGYWHPFRQRQEGRPIDLFQPGTTFQDAVDLYVFDKRLRLIILDALERMEVALRVSLSHTLGRISPFAHLDPAVLHESFAATLDRQTCLPLQHRWLAKQAKLICASKEEFVRHNRAKYGWPLPVWIACEVWEFGLLSQLFAGLREAEQDEIAQRYGVGNGRILATWLRSLNYLRNVCAHHCRLWNRNIIDQPRLPQAKEMPWVIHFEHDAHARARCFLLLQITRHILQHINPASSWPSRMKALLQAFPARPEAGVTMRAMGAPDDWEQQWQDTH